MPDPKLSRIPVKIEVAGDTHIGGRTHNEDAIQMRPDLSLYMLADGAGGQNAGNVASSLALTTIAHFFEQTAKGAAKLAEYDGLGLPTAARRLSAAVQEANTEILEIAKTSDKHKGMGTTIVAALLDVAHRALHVAYVGDSRCYRYRDQRLEQLTFDHSLINDVLELRPNIEDARVKKLPQNVITRALGMSDDLRVSIRSHILEHGDRYMMCSDGLSDVVSDAQIAEALALDVDCDQQVQLLMNMALEAGADDNVAVVVIDVALPSGSSKVMTRPIKKVHKRSSRDKMRRDNAPEIVLYDQIPAPRNEDSSATIHVVPPEGTTDDVVDAVHNVLAKEGAPPPRVASRPPPPMPIEGRYAMVDVTQDSVPPPGKPSLLSDIPARRSSAPKDKRSLSAPRLNKPHVDAEVETDKPPSSTPTQRPLDELGAQAPDSSAPGPAFSPPVGPSFSPPVGPSFSPPVGPGPRATPMFPPPEAVPGRAPPIVFPPAELELADDSSADLDTQVRQGPASATLDSRVPSTKLGPPGLPQKRPTAERSPRPGAPQQRGKKEPETVPGPPSAPPIVIGHTEGGTQRPMPPALPRGNRHTLTGNPHGQHGPGGPTPDAPGVPPMREPFDTSEFTGDDSIGCHACGSIISKRAEICMYCGATTGYVTKP